jgi:hypothetical protein
VPFLNPVQDKICLESRDQDTQTSGLSDSELAFSEYIEYEGSDTIYAVHEEVVYTNPNEMV